MERLCFMLVAILSKANHQLTESSLVNSDRTLAARRLLLRTCRQLEPIRAISVVVQIFAPFDQVVDFIVKMLVSKLGKLLVVKGIVVKFFELLLEPSRVNRCLVYGFALFIYKLGVLCISIKFAEPFDLFLSLLLGVQYFPDFGVEMELFCFIAGLDFNLVERGKDFVGDWPPTIVFNAVIPSVEIVVLRSIERDVDCGLALFLL
jgi:hypothetical protein